MPYFQDIRTMNIVVTGASKGIGRAIALTYANAGHKVAICARTEKALKAVAAKAPEGSIIYKTCDVTDAEELHDFYDFVKKKFRNIDILVNNAGIFLPGQISNEEEGTLETLIETNLYSAYRLTRLFLPEMMARKKGHIFNMCSIASIKAYEYGGSYAISKFAMYGMNKAMREELKRFDIKVTAILPGATLTDSWAGTDLPASRFMKAQDVADLVYAVSMLSPGAVVEDILLRPMKGDI